MLKDFITALNWISIIVWAGVLGFLSLGFFLGTQEDKLKLVEDPVQSFIGRFTISGLAGILGIGILVLLNFFLNRTILQDNYTINLKKLFIKSSLIVLTACFVGTLVFILA